MVLCTAQRGAWDRQRPNAGGRSLRGWQQEGQQAAAVLAAARRQAACLAYEERSRPNVLSKRRGTHFIHNTSGMRNAAKTLFLAAMPGPAGEAPTRRQALQLATGLAVAPLLAGSAQAAKGEVPS